MNVEELSIEELQGKIEETIVAVWYAAPTLIHERQFALDCVRELRKRIDELKLKVIKLDIERLKAESKALERRPYRPGFFDIS
jgi:hypothetical protein